MRYTLIWGILRRYLCLIFCFMLMSFNSTIKQRTYNSIGQPVIHIAHNAEGGRITKERTGGGLNKRAIFFAPLFSTLSVFPN